MQDICKDLFDTTHQLDHLLSTLNDDTWQLKTPFYDWTIKDQVQHLSFFDYAGHIAATDRNAFYKEMGEFLQQLPAGEDIFDHVNRLASSLSPADLLAEWRKHRTEMIGALEKKDPRERLPWTGPDMSARLFTTARLMEVWAHGHDICEALDIPVEPDDRLKHVAHMGFATFKWSFKNRNLPVPDEPVRLELEGPSGDLWKWGEQHTDNCVCGSALDFCLVVTRRRHVKNTGLSVTGTAAEKWMEIAQAFAGEPDDGPSPLV